MAQRIEQPPQGVAWRDLARVSRYQFVIELALPLPWLLASIWLYSGPFWPLGLIASFFFFLCCLRLNHEAIHGNLGLARRWDHAVMHGLSALMLGSNHADAFCHLLHHKDTLGEGDHEGHCADMPAWKVLLYGPRFPVDLNRAAWRQGGARWRRRVVIDWVLIVAFAGLCLASGQRGLQFHVAAMAIGQCLTAFFAVWITHQGTIGTGLAGRSQRGPLAFLAYHMFYHREHHLFPKVPVSRLPDLARRLDSTVAGYAQQRLAVVPLSRESRRGHTQDGGGKLL
ncbi:fatty acid desaturase [Paracoccus sp. M683]|uniref:fatty acid desaturase n=1 Tax=Paracoccus sp. M683 TaxID=2594268 RepID=UPI00117F8713|nr:fatty acid desaturase [Paracoccus sp. M683]TRW99354.1 fatty acid desaturase [Paracoccus sp. M683]